jgi:hypothetical protein
MVCCLHRFSLGNQNAASSAISSKKLGMEVSYHITVGNIAEVSVKRRTLLEVAYNPSPQDGIYVVY